MIGVIGSTRFMGKFIVNALHHAGESVVRLVRDPDKARTLVGPEIDVEFCDLAALPDDRFNLACVVSTAHIEFASEVLDLCGRTGCSRAIFMSSAWVHSQHQTEHVRKSIQGEETVQQSDVVWTILRPTMVYGDGDRNVSVLRKRMLRFPVLPVIGSGECLVQPVYVEDVAYAIAAAVSCRSSEEACFELCGPTPMTYSEIIDRIASSVGKNPLKVYVPASIAYLIAWAVEKFGSRWLKRDQVKRMMEDRAFSISEAETALGFFPRTFDEGLHETVVS